MAKKQKSTVPTKYGWFVSYQDYQDVYGTAPQDTPIYLHSHADGSWFKNGEPFPTDQLPEDLEQIRHTQY